MKMVTLPFSDRAALALTDVVARLDKGEPLTAHDIYDVVKNWTTSDLYPDDDGVVRIIDFSDFNRLSHIVWTYIEQKVAEGAYNEIHPDEDAE